MSYLLLEVLVHQTLAVLDSKLWEIPRFLLLKSTQGGTFYFRTGADEEDFISEYSTFSQIDQNYDKGAVQSAERNAGLL